MRCKVSASATARKHVVFVLVIVILYKFAIYVTCDTADVRLNLFELQDIKPQL